MSNTSSTRPQDSEGSRALSAREPHEPHDKYFALRVGIDGGAVDLAQLRALADISTRYARGTADITDRQNIQFHRIRVEDVPAIREALERVGLRATKACGDTPRVVLGSPVAGAAADEILDETPAVKEIQRRYAGNPSLAGLPRTFRTTISGSPHQDVGHETNDVSFVGIDHPGYGPGFDLWVGGGLTASPIPARRLGAFVPLEDVAEVWFGVVRVFRDYGRRRPGNRARLAHLVADWGTERFREVLETEYLGRRLQDCPPPPPPPRGSRDHVGVHKQRRGRFYVGAAPVAGRMSGEVLRGLADAVGRAGSNRIRFAPDEKVVVLDVLAPDVADLLDNLERIGLAAEGGTHC